MAAKPQGIIDDIIKLGIKGTKATLKGTRTSRKVAASKVKEASPSKKALTGRRKLANAQSLYQSNPKKYPDARGYLAEGQSNAMKEVSGYNRAASRAKAQGKYNTYSNTYKGSLRKAATGRRKSAIEGK
jgi:hypothetical protein